ncbi:sugar ABC transporter ATP-binding protein [Mesorhizobium sp. BAC0120]|uniref:sugar ABC transporter ATP-binding protein n=1 Tax=Mesorhizobium sp. BAC0120 TaxID=3090670 RepID=UPI00298C701A|nr:sugar ABC transporter ATP-binding protein [Mesorhizobium sp. BAC0120]MDW6023660.1 sugar ABC transporter ATP-binding protein [Mesorhizobium sp. BAC0120]
MASGHPLFPLEIEGISKRFGAVAALTDVSLRLEQGICLALLGENGAGKSTLMRILAGAIQPDTGRITAAGQKLVLPDARAAQRAGVYLCHQELQTVPQMTVRQNLELGSETTSFGFVRKASGLETVTRELRSLGFSRDLDTAMGELSIAERQLVLIAKGLRDETQLVILDEPTAALAPAEVTHVTALVRRLVTAGKSVVYISHRLDEIGHVADRVLVLRDGMIVGELPPTASEELVVKKMVGREIRDLYPRRERTPGELVLSIKDLHTAGASGIDLELRVGEIVGVGGLVGAGQKPLAQAIYGRQPLISGEIRAGGDSLRNHTVADAVRAGIGYVGEDRRHEGLVLTHSILDNITLPIARQESFAGFLKNRRLAATAAELAATLHVRSAGLQQPAGELSGGNQQKIVLARALATKPRTLILLEPTRGVDVGARADIYQLLDDLTRQGLGILLITSDLSELLGLSDRVVMLYRGTVSGHVSKSEANAERLGALATGQGARQ